MCARVCVNYYICVHARIPQRESWPIAGAAAAAVRCGVNVGAAESAGKLHLLNAHTPLKHVPDLRHRRLGCGGGGGSGRDTIAHSYTNAYYTRASRDVFVCRVRRSSAICTLYTAHVVYDHRAHLPRGVKTSTVARRWRAS